tara:strand:- start:522 stop:782 length:261 start_codon:yes stop_codon:yes gene_type:complete
MKIKTIHISLSSYCSGDIYSSVDIDPDIEGLELKSMKLSQEATLKVIRIAEEDIKDDLVQRVKDLSQARLQPAVNLIEAKTIVIKD